MSTIPNELKIIIYTSIPGFQTIRYKPSMTIPDEKTNNAVQFNPLVKLKTSVIKSLPENVQKREFFNKGLFQSLVNSHGLVKNASLLEATKNGYVDNNIKVTLDTLFPSNSVLYINKQPYAIADVQWTKGDWKIDEKIQQVPQTESNKVNEPYLYKTIIKAEIISGEDELQKLPKEIVYGPNYTGPPNVASGVKTTVQPSTSLGPPMGPPMGPPIKPSKPSGIRPISPKKPTKLVKPAVPIVTPIKPTSLPSNISLAYEAKEREIQKQYLNLVHQQKQLLQQQQFVSQQLLNQENKLSNDKRRLFLEQEEQIRKEREKLKIQQELLSQELNMLRLKFESYRLKMFRNKEIMDSTNKYPYGNPYGNPFDTPALPPANPYGNPYGNPFDTPALPPANPYGNPFDTPALPPSDPEIVEDKEIIKIPKKNIVLEPSKKSTEKLRTFFENSNYYFMLNIMFQNMEAPEKDKINEIFKEATGVDAKAVKGLSKSAYDKTVINMKVIKNAGGGDCFFIAVADAINYYNANVNANANKITYENNYGIKTPFTQLALRKIVSYFILFENETPFEQLVTILEYKVKDMNDMFQIAYETFINDVGPVTPNIFFDLIDNIYKNPEIDNFLVKKPTEMTSETVQNPFRMITKNELETYITSSDYWGNPIAINALCEILGLNVVVIENINNIMRAPYIYHGNNEWNKYVFIYNEVEHYELITFDFVFNNKQSPVTKTIFKNNFLNPPFYIIFLIFASNYYKIREQIDKKQFKLLPILMEKLFDIYNKIELNSSNSSKKIKKTSDKFLTLFKDFFLTPPILRRDNSFEVISSKSNYNNPFEGGALNPYQYKSRLNNRPYQTQTYPLTRSPYSYSFIKTPTQTQNVTPESNYSYYITIDMYLKKGTELSSKDISNLKCDHRWNSIRKNYATLRGLKYTHAPNYNITPVLTKKKESTTKTNKLESKSKSKTQKWGLDLKKKNNRTKKRNYLAS
jgi:hypothetical protein